MVFEGKVGVEIECMSENANAEILKIYCGTKKWKHGGDGSIRNTHAGEEPIEFKSKPYQISEMQELIADTTEIFNRVRVNSSCGLHIHISFKNVANYYKLLSWKFVDQFQKALKLYFKTKTEKKRFTCSYSLPYNQEEQFKIDTQQQLASTFKGGPRYRCINFNAYNLFKTIEFRIFPATNKIEKFEKYLKFLIKNIDEYLINNGVPITNIKDGIKGRKLIKQMQNDGPIIIREIIKKEDINNG